MKKKVSEDHFVVVKEGKAKNREIVWAEQCKRHETQLVINEAKTEMGKWVAKQSRK